MADIGGINVSFGVDLSRFSEGIRDAENRLQSFHKAVGRIGLEGIVTGDPFSKTKKFFKEAENTVRKVMDSWLEATDNTTGGLNKFEKNTRKIVAKLIQDFENLNRKIGKKGVGTVSSALDAAVEEISSKTRSTRKDKTPSLKGLKGWTTQDVADQLNSSIKAINNKTPEMRAAWKKWNSAIGNKDSRATKDQAVKAMTSLRKALNRESKRLDEDLRQAGDKINKTIKEVERNRKKAFLKEYRESRLLPKFEEDAKDRHKIDLEAAGAIGQAQERRRMAVRALRIEELKLQRDISAGNDIEASRNRLLKVQEGLMKRGEKTLKLTAVAQAKLNRLAKVEGLKKRAQEYRKLYIARKELLEVLRKGNVTQSQANRLEKINIALIKLKPKLMQRLTEEMKKFQTQAARKEQKEGFLSPTWFKTRARWFLQLRGFWAIYRGITEGFRQVVLLEKAMGNLQAVTQATDTELLIMSKSVKQIAKDLAIDITTIAEGMVKLGQAGLSPEEVTLAIKDVSTLAVATLTDMATAADLVTTVMRAWGEEAGTTADIIDVMSSAVNNSKIQIQGLGTALQYLTGVAPQVGLSFQQTAGIIGVMANQGLKMSKIGTGLRSLLGELLRPSKRFARELHKVGLTLQDVSLETHDVVTVLETLSASGFNAASAFKGMDRRAAAAIASIVKKAGGLRSFIKNLGLIGSAAEMASIQMETLANKTVVLKNKMIVLVSGVYDRYKSLMKLFVDTLGNIATALDSLGNTAKTVLGFLTDATIILGIVALTTSLFSLTKVITLVRKALTLLQKVWLKSLIFTGIALAITGLIKLYANYKYAVDNAREAAMKFNAEAISKKVELASLERLAENYLAAVKEGNKEDADRIALQHEGLTQIQATLSSYKDILEAVTALTDKEREKLEIIKEGARLKSIEVNEIKLQRIKKREIERQNRERLLGKTPLGQDTQTYNFLPSTLRRRAKERKEINAGRLKDIKSINEMIKNTAAIEIAQIKSSKSMTEGYSRINKETSGFVTLLEEIEVLLGRGSQPFAQLMDEINRGVRKTDESVKELDISIKKITLPETADPKIIREFFNTMINSNKELEHFFRTNKTQYNALIKIIDKDPEKAATLLNKLQENLRRTGLDWVTTIEEIIRFNPKTYLSLKQKLFKELVTLKNLMDEDKIFSLSKILDLDVSEIKEDLEKFPNTVAEALTLKPDKQADIFKKYSVFARKYAAITKSLTLGKGILPRSEALLLQDFNTWIAKIENSVAKLGKTQTEAEKQIANVELQIAKALTNFGIIETKDINARLVLIKLQLKLEGEILDKAEQQLGIAADRQEEVNTLLTTTNQFERRRLNALRVYNKKYNDLIIKYGKGVFWEKEHLRYTELINVEKERAIDLANLDEALDNEKIETQKKIIENTRVIAGLQLLEPAEKEQILELEYDSILLEEQRIKNQLELYRTSGLVVEKQKEMSELNNQLDKLEQKRIKNQYDLRREADALYRVYTNIVHKIADWRDNFIDLIETQATSGLTDALNNITRGFEKQREEANQLKGTLAGLEQQYQEALAEGNAERVAEITREMDMLKSQIEDLENPVKSLGATFKEFFVDLAKEIQNAINRWIAMQILMKITGAITSSAYNAAGGLAGSGPAFSGMATGGVLPNIKSFRRFSRGGITSNPAMAILGDNPSGKELVIPSENISKNRVDGYVRDGKQPLNIINVLTEEDIANAMVSKAGERAVINLIGRDMGKRGPIYRTMRV